MLFIEFPKKLPILTVLCAVLFLGSGCTDSQGYSSNISAPEKQTQGVPYTKPNQPTPADENITPGVEKTAPTRTYTAPTQRTISEPAPAARTCCKVCSKGKACGDSCISKSYTCHKPPGCACDAN